MVVSRRPLLSPWQWVVVVSGSHISLVLLTIFVHNNESRPEQLVSTRRVPPSSNKRLEDLVKLFRHPRTRRA